MIAYFKADADKLVQASLEHVQLTVSALFFALVFAFILTGLLYFLPKLREVSVYILSLFYAVPSFALFALLIPVTGLGKTTAIVALAAYAQYILVRSFLAGHLEVDPSLIEAAQGMGMTKGQILRKIRLPLAVPAIMSGIRLAATSIIMIATIGATIQAGGLGTILFDGLRTNSIPKLVWGIILSIAITLWVNLFLYLIEEICKPEMSRS